MPCVAFGALTDTSVPIIISRSTSAKSIVRPLTALTPQNGGLGLKSRCNDHHQKTLVRNLLFRDFGILGRFGEIGQSKLDEISRQIPASPRKKMHI